MNFVKLISFGALNAWLGYNIRAYEKPSVDELYERKRCRIAGTDYNAPLLIGFWESIDPKPNARLLYAEMQCLAIAAKENKS